MVADLLGTGAAGLGLELLAVPEDRAYGVVLPGCGSCWNCFSPGGTSECDDVCGFHPSSFWLQYTDMV